MRLASLNSFVGGEGIEMEETTGWPNSLDLWGDQERFYQR